ncbi:MAG: DNA alkylation repair protein [Nitrospirae bacterium]|nr:MAG: DNA alkylation repair protein [Nitrospirota bacterium]
MSTPDTKPSWRVQEVRQALHRYASVEKAQRLRQFFKTGKGEYAEQDVFIGVTVPEIRKVVAQFQDLPLDNVLWFLASPLHEERMLAVLLLVTKFQKGHAAARRHIVQMYIQHLHAINNWDLVDASAPHILGAYLQDKRRTLLDKLVRSENMWARRAAIVATLHFIKRGEFADTLRLATRLLADQEDLLHKATGWMLREVGKRAPNVLEDFLRVHLARMPRTMLRYATERFPQAKREAYLKGLLNHGKPEG